MSNEKNYVTVEDDDEDYDLQNITKQDNKYNINTDKEIINENDRSDNVYNYLSNTRHAAYNTLINYVKQFEKSKSDISFKKPNICDVYLKKAYDIPINKIDNFMVLLNKCRNDNFLKLNFTELQLSDIDNKVGSGLMYDFDILQDEKYSKLTDFGFANLIGEILNIVNTVLNINPNNIKTLKINHYACIIKKPSIEFKENEGKYKDGFHILIPSIQTTKEVKRYIFQKLLLSNKIKTLFECVNIKEDLCEIMDKGSYSVPVHFISNCKVNKEAYIVFKKLKILYTFSEFQMPESMDDILLKPEINLCYEFSLNYTKSDGIIKKYYYDATEEIQEEIEYDVNSKDSSDEFLDKNINDISILSLHNPNTKFIRELLYLLSDNRSKDRNMWRDVIYALVNESPILKPLAIEFSKRNSIKWDPVGFEKLWNEAISNVNENKLTLRSIIYWAKTDSPGDYEKLISKDIKQIIKTDICANILQGNLFHYQYAKYLQYMFNEKFITDEVNGKTMWYEFVIESDRSIKGQVYKWREEPRPDNLYIYVSAILPSILNEIIQETDNYIKTIKDNDELLEYFIKLKNNIINSTRKLYDTGFKIKLMKEAEVLFRRRGFTDSLNKDQNIMGVGNGILVLSEKPYLIKSYHNFPITIFSPINYIEYDENNPNIQLLEKTMGELFPEHEMDALEFMLYYFATCLDGIPKDSMIFIITGAGGNGKSFLLNLVKEVLGESYCRRLPLAFLTDKRTKSSGADPALMDLEMARLAHYSESEKNEELNTSKMKEITGQESLSGRNLYEKQKNFRPTCHHIITTNHDFDIKTTDNGTWRRIKKYVFKMKFCSNPDPNNPFEKKENPGLAKEFSYNILMKEAFLSILVKYYKNLHKYHGGILSNVPKPTIDKETEEYRNSQDIINRFISNFIIIAADSELSMNELVDSYKGWYSNNIDNSEMKVPNAELGKQLSNSKIGKFIKRNINGINFKGIRTIESGLPEIEKNEYFICNNKQEEYLKSL
jgi:phage/plasmid-associated DNA primase